jgi:hypothetical protein
VDRFTPERQREREKVQASELQSPERNDHRVLFDLETDEQSKKKKEGSNRSAMTSVK